MVVMMVASMVERRAVWLVERRAVLTVAWKELPMVELTASKRVV